MPRRSATAASMPRDSRYANAAAPGAPSNCLVKYCSAIELTSWSTEDLVRRRLSESSLRNSVSIPALRASFSKASLNSMPSWRITNSNMSPPTPHAPQHRQAPCSGEMLKDGVRSSWKGQRAFGVRDDGLSRAR